MYVTISKYIVMRMQCDRLEISNKGDAGTTVIPKCCKPKAREEIHKYSHICALRNKIVERKKDIKTTGRLIKKKTKKEIQPQV